MCSMLKLNIYFSRTLSLQMREEARIQYRLLCSFPILCGQNYLKNTLDCNRKNYDTVPNIDFDITLFF